VIVKNILKKRAPIAALMSLFCFDVYAADILAQVRYIDYALETNEAANYSGWETEIIITPEDSAQYFPLEARQYDFESGNKQQRFAIGTGYLFNLDAWYINPEVKLRRDTTESPVNEMTADGIITKAIVKYEVNNWLTLAGRVDVDLVKRQHDKLSQGLSDTYYRYETELQPSVRFTPFANTDALGKGPFKHSFIDVIYFYYNARSTRGGVESDTGGNFMLGENNEIQQYRIESTFKFKKFTISPYTRQPIGDVTSNNYSNSISPFYTYQSTRYGVKTSFNVHPKIALIAEYYHETKNIDSEFEDIKTDDTANQFELGIKFKI